MGGRRKNLTSAGQKVTKCGTMAELAAEEMGRSHGWNMLISLHLPKTAGTSVRWAMRSHFGAGLVEDYAAPPMQLRRGRREVRTMLAAMKLRGHVPQTVSAVHGHFLPLKYRLAMGGGSQFVTWMRDPVERVVSHYHYWRRDYACDDPSQVLRNRVVGEDWSLERFCLGPEMRNLYEQFLWGFDPRQFEFIGIAERYSSDFAQFTERYLDGAPEAAAALANPDRGGDQYDIPADLRARIREHHAADVALYEWARDRRGR